MRIAIATVQAPFIRGGAESLTAGLAAELRRAGHDAEIVSMPFRFTPTEAVSQAMDAWGREDFEDLNGRGADLVICLKFPAYYLSHSRKVVWLIHQHRPAYDLWGTSFDSGLSKEPDGERLRAAIVQADTSSLARCKARYTIGCRVSERLKRYNGLRSTPLYHPPLLRNRLYSASIEPFIFFPSRLEALKRQDLLVEAMHLVRSPVVALMAGEGGMREALECRIRERGLEARVRLLGQISDEEVLAYYAHCLAAFYGPYDEDYGLVPLEAMLAGKPVVTCLDSGEPVRFVVDRVTGRVVDPVPEALAEAIDDLYYHPSRVAAMGKAARERYESLDISWDRVLGALLPA